MAKDSLQWKYSDTIIWLVLALIFYFILPIFGIQWQVNIGWIALWALTGFVIKYLFGEQINEATKKVYGEE